MKMEKDPEDNQTKLGFDPLEWLTSSETPSCNPGELLRSCGLQAGKVIEASQGDSEIQNQALDLLNMVAGTLQIGWKNSDGTFDEEAIRQSLVAMYLVGLDSARLAITTRHDAASIDQAINELKQQVRSSSAKKAADARHSKPGGSRDLKAQIQEIWATGKYQSRDICAEQEWAGLGFGSPKAARNALINTPPPTCAQQVPTARSGNSRQGN